MRKVDLEALQRAIRMVKTDPAERRWILDKIRDDGWEDAALSAAYRCQTETLHLRPWQPPPCWMDDDRPRDDHPLAGKVAAWELRRRLLKAGLSMYEPDPVGRLEAVAARQRGENRAAEPREDPSERMPAAQDS